MKIHWDPGILFVGNKLHLDGAGFCCGFLLHAKCTSQISTCTGECAIKGGSLNYFATFSPKSIKGPPHVLQLPVRLLRRRLVLVFLVPNHDHRQWKTRQNIEFCIVSSRGPKATWWGEDDAAGEDCRIRRSLMCSNCQQNTTYTCTGTSSCKTRGEPVPIP